MSVKKPTYEELAERVAALEQALADRESESARVRGRAAPEPTDRQVEADLLHFLDQATDGFILLDADLRIVRVSESSARGLGLRPEQVVGQDLREVYVEAEPSGRYEAYRRVLETGEPFTGDAVFQTEGGERHVALKALRVGEGLGIIGVDITAPKQAEAALRRSEQRYALAERAARMGSWEWDLRTGQGTWTEPLERMAGLQPGGFGGTRQDLLDHIYPADLDRATVAFERCGRDGQPYNVEYRLVRADGTVRWVQDTGEAVRGPYGTPERAVGVCVDVTERRQGEETRRALIDQSLLGMVVIEGRRAAERHIVLANPAFAEMVGYTAEELTAMRPDEIDGLVLPEDRELVRSRHERRTAGKPVPARYEFRLLHKNGSVRWVELSGAQTLYRGRPAVQAFYVDITARKEVEQEHRRLTEELERRVEERTADLEATNRELAEEIVERQEAQEALADSERRYRTVAESARESIFIIGPDLTVRYVNSHAAGRLRRTPEAAVGLHLDQLFQPEAIGEQKKHLRSVFETGQPVTVESRVAFAHAPDREVWLDTQLTPLRDSAGAVEAVMGVARDTTRRRQAEQALSESEAKYRTLFDASLDAIFLERLDGRVLDANARAVEMYGYAPDELVGLNVTDLVPTEVAATLPGVIAEQLAAGGIRTEALGTRKDGSVFPTEVSTRLVELGGEKRALVYVRDITREKQAEQTLRRTQRERAAVLDSLSEHVIYHDTNMVIVWANRSACDSVGLTPEEIVGRNCYELWQDRSTPCDGCPVKRALETGQRHEGETASPDGRQWLVSGSPVRDESGELVGVVEITMDITDRKRAEAALRDSEERYRAVFEQAADSIVLVDRETGALVEFNDSACRNLGYTRDEFSRLTLADIDVIESVQKVAAHLSKVVRQGHDTFETKQRRKDGDVRDVHVSTRVISTRGRQFILSVWRDITEQNRAREALRESEERYRTIYGTIPDGVFLYDPETTKLVSANDVMLELYGYTRDEVEAGKVGLFDLVPEGERDRIREERAASLDRPGAARRGVRPSVKKDGTLMWVDATTAPIEFGGQRLRLAILRDVTERMQAREALRESEERYRTIYGAIPDAVLFYDPATKRLVSANDVMLELFGYARDEVEAGEVQLAGLVPDAERDRVRRAIVAASAQPGPGRRGVFRGVKKDGALVWLDATSAPIEFSGQRLRMVILRDVTEQVQAREALRESEERYRSLFENAIEGVAISRGDRIINANQALLDLFGYDSVAAFGAVPLLQHVAPHHRQMVRDKLGRAAADRARPTRYELDVLRKDGEVRTADVSATEVLIGEDRLIQSTFRDVTDSVRARAQIERQAMLLANVTDVIAVTGPDGTLTYWNRGAEELFGYRQDEMLGRAGVGLLLRDPGQEAEIGRAIQSAATDGIVWSHGRLPCRRKSGEDLWVNVRASALEPGPGEPEGVLFVARDVTASVLLEQRLILAERMATVGTLGLSVSHELNNLLGGLRGLAGLAAENAELVPRLLEACRAVADRGAVIAGRMASLAKADAPGEERRLDVASVARTVVNMMGPSLAPRNITVDETYEPVPPTWMNEGQILQVLLNLVANARDGIGRDGRIGMSVGFDADADRIVVSVADDGAGIAPDELPRLFEPFFTTKSAPGPGGEEPSHLGLGLAESRSIVRGYGGTISVDSRPGGGATFTVRLPVRSAPTAARPPATPVALPEKGTRMLVVDDDPLSRFWLTEYLAGQGYEVAARDNGRDAVELCRREPFAYILLDMLMPGEVDGPAAFRRLREVQPEAHIILCTAFVKDQIPDDCLDAAHAMLKKPFTPEELARALAGHGNSGQ